MNEKAFRLGYAFAMGMKQAKRGLAMDSWVTLKNKEGENYRVDLPGENPNQSSKNTSESKKADSHKSLADKIRGANGGTFEHEGKTYQAQSDPEKQAKSIIERQEQIKNRPNIPEGQKYLRNPLKVVRRSDKAYAVENPLYKSAQAAAKRGDYKELTYKEREALKNRQSLIWIPKSRATVKDGTVYGMEGWIAKKGDILTE